MVSLYCKCKTFFLFTLQTTLNSSSSSPLLPPASISQLLPQPPHRRFSLYRTTLHLILRHFRCTRWMMMVSCFGGHRLFRGLESFYLTTCLELPSCS
ncbi:hypothetical protein ACFX13_040108 [Malus domestica]